MITGLILGIVLIIVSIFALTVGPKTTNEAEKHLPYIVGIGAAIFACIVFFLAGDLNGAGKIGDAENLLKIGQVYECLTEPVPAQDEKKQDCWDAIIAICSDGKNLNSEHFALRFPVKPPKKGLVAKMGDKIIYLSYDKVEIK